MYLQIEAGNHSCATPYLSVRSHCFTSHMLWRKEANIVPPVSNFTLLQMLLISPCWSLPRTPSGVCYRGLISFHRLKFPQTRKQITSDTIFGHSVFDLKLILFRVWWRIWKSFFKMLLIMLSRDEITVKNGPNLMKCCTTNTYMPT